MIEGRIKVENTDDFDKLPAKIYEVFLCKNAKFEISKEDEEEHIYLVTWKDNGGAPPNNITKKEMLINKTIFSRMIYDSSLPHKFLNTVPLWCKILNINYWMRSGSKKVGVSYRTHGTDDGVANNLILGTKVNEVSSEPSKHKSQIMSILDSVTIRPPYPFVIYEFGFKGNIYDAVDYLVEIDKNTLVALYDDFSEMSIIYRVGGILFTVDAPVDIKEVENLGSEFSKNNNIKNKEWKSPAGEEVIIERLSKHSGMVDILESIEDGTALFDVLDNILREIDDYDDLSENLNALQELNLLSNIGTDNFIDLRDVCYLNYRILKHLFPAIIP